MHAEHQGNFGLVVQLDGIEAAASDVDQGDLDRRIVKPRCGHPPVDLTESSDHLWGNAPAAAPESIPDMVTAPAKSTTPNITANERTPHRLDGAASRLAVTRHPATRTAELARICPSGSRRR